MGKPRMTQRDRWHKRPKAERYWAYKAELQLAWDAKLSRDVLLEPYVLVFWIPMPKSWSKRKRGEMIGKPHRQKPDKDNLEKGVLDALMGEDMAAWCGLVAKFWSDAPAIGYAPLRNLGELLGVGLDDSPDAHHAVVVDAL